MATIRISGDQVDIDNIATESTLGSLVRAVGGAAGGAGSLAGNLGGAGENASLMSRALQGVTSAATVGAGGLADFAAQAYNGTARVSTALDYFATNTSGLSSTLLGAAKGITAHVEDVTDSFRTLSRSGGGFAADLFELKNSAAQTRMTLDEFSGMVASNSESLAALGGTVNRGSRLFTTMSQEFFEASEGYAQRLTNMGMTTEEINENLMLMTEIQQRQNMQDEKVRQSTQASAMSLAEEMDAMAKLTGKQKDAIQEEMMASMRKGQVEAKFRKIEMEQGKEAAAAARASYAEAMTNAQMAGPDAVAALEETFVLGGVRSEQARAGIVALGSAANDAQTVFRTIANSPMTPVDGLITNMNAAIVQRIQDPNFLNTAMLASAGNEYGQAAATMLENAGQYETAISRFMEEGMGYADAVKAARDQVAAEADARRGPGEDRTAGQELGRGIVQTELQIKNLGAAISEGLIGPNGQMTALKTEFRNFADFMQTGLTPQAINESVTGLINSIGQQLGLDPAPAGPTVPREGTPEDQAADTTVAETVLANAASYNEEQAKSSMLLVSTLLNDVEAGALRERLEEQASEAGVSLAEFVDRIIRDSSYDDLLNMVAEATGRNEQRLNRRVEAAIDVGESMSPARLAEELQNVVSDMSVTARTVNVNNGRSGGSLGAVGSLLEDFGQGTLTELHGREGVITEEQLTNMARGMNSALSSESARSASSSLSQLLQSLDTTFSTALEGGRGNTVASQLENLSTSFTTSMNNVTANSSRNSQDIDLSPMISALGEMQSNFRGAIEKMQSSGTQEGFKEIAEQLNSTMGGMAGQLAQGNRVATKQLRSIGGLSGNLFKGLG